MRGNIVVPDDIDAVTGFSPGLASMCEELSRPRYLRTKAKDGLTVAQSIHGMYRTMVWCQSTLNGKKLPTFTRSPLPQKGLTRRFLKLSKSLDLLSAKYRTQGAKSRLLVLPDPEFQGMIAFRADLVLGTTNVLYQIYQYHLRRAFYTFDRDSGFMFPGGDRSYLKQYEASVISKLFPIW
jgi:hypothetical protein